jgi:hypothetical protein
MTDDIKPLGIQHAKITGQVMRDHWGPIVDRIAADSLSQHCPNCEAQAAEIERLGSVIDATALHWLALQDKHHVPWEGAIDGAMAAACAEIAAQAAEIAMLRDVVDALLQHEASSFFGPDEGKHKRASWRGVIRKAKKARAGKAEQ